MRRGQSLLQLVVTLVIIGVLAAIAVPRLAGALDRQAARGARQQLVATLAAARAVAFARATAASVVLDSVGATARLTAGADTVLVRPLFTEFGVTVHATRDSVTYAANGRGLGAANTTIIVARGAAAETVLVSRLGRVRW